MYGNNYYGYGAVPDTLGQYRAQYIPAQMQPMQMPPAQSAGAQAPQSPSGETVWVQGEAGAKSFIVAPGKSAMLMDSEAHTFYIKSADASGIPQPLRIFDYIERSAAPAKEVTKEEYVTRREFEELSSKLEALTLRHTNAAEDNTNG